jgi:hypothetical protein
MRKRFWCGALVAAIFGCTCSPVFAAEAEQQAVREHCETELNVPAGTCPCLATKAAEMNEGQQQLLAAMLTNDEATATRLRTQLPVDQVMQVGMFHVHQTPACAGGG